MKQSQDPYEILQLRGYMRSNTPNGRIDSYLEIGSYAGESLTYMAELFHEDTQVVLVDLGDNHKAREALVEVIKGLDCKVQLITGDSTDLAVTKRVAELCPHGKYDLCFIDGCHDYDYVLSDIRTYARYANKVAMHDINPDAIPRQLQKHGYPKPCAAHLWKVVKLFVPYSEFINTNSQVPMGIGVFNGDKVV